VEQIYIEWRDAVGKSRHTGPEDDRPKSAVLRGTVWLIDEDEDDLLVAAWLANDGGYMDMMALPKVSIEKREPVKS